MRLANGVWVGAPEAGLTPLRALRLIVLVGVTGVGKSTTLEALRQAGLRFGLLPDRREITDAVIFGGEVIADRARRFERTAAYRADHPGGMAEALERVSVDTRVLPEPILFDGLRGLNELEHAAHVFPRAVFVALDAPDTLRVRRLLGRGDAFDRVGGTHTPAGASRLEALKGVPGALEVFSESELHQLSALEASPEDLAAKLSIVVTERQHYDPRAANAFLQTLGGSRGLYVNTGLEPAEAVARRILAWWKP